MIDGHCVGAGIRGGRTTRHADIRADNIDCRHGDVKASKQNESEWPMRGQMSCGSHTWRMK